jgi:hypothetical protein
MDTIMSTYNGNSPAMPQEWQSYVDAAPMGLTKREYFAGLAMQGLLASGRYVVCDETSEEAWSAAESLLYTQDRVDNN